MYSYHMFICFCMYKLINLHNMLGQCYHLIGKVKVKRANVFFQFTWNLFYVLSGFLKYFVIKYI